MENGESNYVVVRISSDEVRPVLGIGERTNLFPATSLELLAVFLRITCLHEREKGQDER